MLIAQAMSNTNWDRLLTPQTLAILVPVTAILVGGAIYITKMWIRHRERLAMIEHGMHPDQPPSQQPGDRAER